MMMIRCRFVTIGIPVPLHIVIGTTVHILMLISSVLNKSTSVLALIKPIFIKITPSEQSECLIIISLAGPGFAGSIYVV